MSENVINLSNIQCIKEAKNIKITDNVLNIKYGFNGLGKSSIGKALNAYINETNKEKALKPFTPFGAPEDTIPSLEITPENKFSSCVLFDKAYIDNNLFQSAGNVMRDANNIYLLSNTQIQKAKNDIDTFLVDLRRKLENPYITDWAKKCSSVIDDKSPVNEDGTYNAKSAVAKGLNKSGEISLFYDPDLMAVFGCFIDSKNYKEWATLRGKIANSNCYKESNTCPICGSKYEVMSKARIDALIAAGASASDQTNVGVAYDKLTTLGELSTSDDNDKLQYILHASGSTTDAQKNEILRIYKYMENELNKFKNLQNIQTTFNLNDGKETTLIDALNSFKLDVDVVVPRHDNVNLENAINEINGAIDTLISNIHSYFVNIETFNTLTTNALNESMNEVNEFLEQAGIPYSFQIESGNNNLLTKIIPNNTTDECDDVKGSLSYGEQNSLSMALFGAIAKRTNYDLIILDDPISSFDQNKKYAVMNFLFNQKSGMLKDKTVLILTHDLETIIDLYHIDLLKLRKNNKIKPYILTRDTNGLITEKEITKGMIMSTSNCELEYAKDTSKSIFARVVHLRRYFDLNGMNIPGETSSYYAYCMLCGIAHMYEKAAFENEVGLNTFQEDSGTAFIRNNFIDKFNYRNIFNFYSNAKNVISEYEKTDDPFEKLALLRSMFLNKKRFHIEDVDSVTFNYLNEVYHIENTLSYTIKEQSEIMPPYIISICDELVKTIKAKNGIA